MREAIRDQNRKTLRQSIHVWLDQYPEDFQEPPNYPCLNQLETFTSRVMPDSELDQKVSSIKSNLTLPKRMNQHIFT